MQQLKQRGVVVAGPVAVKYGNSRVEAQGHWLQRHWSFGGLPAVHYLGRDCYVMERLDTERPNGWSDVDVACDVIRVLADLWALPWKGRTGSTEHELYARELELGKPWVDCFALPWVTTHGNPTLGNVLWRPRLHSAGGFDLVVTDPGEPWMAGSGRYPPVRAFDLGKLLQSALGWERGTLVDPDFAVVQAVRNACESELEWDATRYACAVHVMSVTRAKYRPELRAEAKAAVEWLREGAR